MEIRRGTFGVWVGVVGSRRVGRLRWRVERGCGSVCGRRAGIDDYQGMINSTTCSRGD